jgi:hypothetical protein
MEIHKNTSVSILKKPGNSTGLCQSSDIVSRVKVETAAAKPKTANA